MTKVEKVKKLMEKYGLTIDDLEDVDDEEETKTEPKEEVKTDKVEEPKETEKKVDTEQTKEEVKVEENPTETKVEETKPVDNGTTEEEKVDPYKVQFEDLNKKYEDLKALVEAQAMKTDKAYEILDAQGKKPEEDEYEFARKLGYQDIQPNIAENDKGGEEFANALQSKKVR